MHQKFPDLSHRAFQHPLDRQALQALEKIKFVDIIIKKFSEWFSEKQFRLISISENIRLGPNQCPTLYNKFVHAAQILDIPKLPEIYVDSDYTINAYAFGMENYSITLCSGLIDMLTEDELMAVIGHELGHVKCNHMLYKTMAHILKEFGNELLSNLLPMGMGVAATMSIQLALYHWYRMAEFSCDRAALLVVQDPKIVASTLTKLAGYSQKLLSEINLQEVIKQADEYHSTDDNLDKFMKLFLTVGRTHPMPIVRVKEIIEWSKSNEYQTIRAGNYLTISADRKTSRVCTNCKVIVTDEAKFCFTCGTSLPELPQVMLGVMCPSCKTTNNAGVKFCFKCGTKIIQ